MRDTFITELIKCAELNKKIVLVVGDLGYNVVEAFAKRFPQRFFNAGIAEQSMAGLAAGLASEGYHVFVYSIANFPTFRCAEQIRNDIDYHKLPVTIVAVGGGLSYGALGYSHHAIQDYALMRTMPNTLIAAPGDGKEVSACLKYLIDQPGPSYFRLGKASEIAYHKDVPVVMPGAWLKIVESRSARKAIITTGTALSIVMSHYAAYKDYDVYSLPLWSMRSKDLQFDIINQYEEIISVEDHLTDGGFGSWLLECHQLSGLNSKIKIIIKGLHYDIVGKVGSQRTLEKAFGLDLSVN